VVLSVVIPTFNKRALLERTLAALRQQELPGQEWEIVVVDDGSTDDTASLLAALDGDGDPQLQVVRPERNVGRAAARNLGGNAARGTWILFLDDDILPPPGLLAAHLELLAPNPGLGTIGHAVTDPGLIDAPHFHYLDSRGVAKLGPGVAPARYFVTQNAAVPRQAFVAAGGFDERFAAYGFEDMELAFRLERDHGVTFHLLPSPIGCHVHHHSLRQYLEKKRECGTSSLPLIAALHPERIREMRLNLILDVPDNPLPHFALRLFRRLARGFPGDVLLSAVSRWPTGRHARPRLPLVYYRAMDLAILCSYSRGLSDREFDNAIKAEYMP